MSGSTRKDLAEIIDGLSWMAGFDRAALSVAKTLHYDMAARAAAMLICARRLEAALAEAERSDVDWEGLKQAYANSLAAAEELRRERDVAIGVIERIGAEISDYAGRESSTTD
jgi:hypothetical protein